MNLYYWIGFFKEKTVLEAVIFLKKAPLQPFSISHSVLWIGLCGGLMKIGGVEKSTDDSRGGLSRKCRGAYQPFLEKMVGRVRVRMYRFSKSDLFWM